MCLENDEDAEKTFFQENYKKKNYSSFEDFQRYKKGNWVLLQIKSKEYEEQDDNLPVFQGFPDLSGIIFFLSFFA